MPFDYFKFTEKLLVPLAGKVAKAFKDSAAKESEAKSAREAELDRITDIFGAQPDALARLYVEPNLQQFNPANEQEDEHVGELSNPALHHFDKWMAGDRETNRRLFVLADAGMGKTSLLVMLKLAHLMGRWPDGVDVQLLKLGETTLDDIKAISAKPRTVLLLDSLDEDPTVNGRVDARMIELLDATQSFRRVVLTCRTQFFSGGDDPFDRRGRVSVGGHIVRVLFLSLFTDAQVDEYLSRRYPRRVRDWLTLRENPKAAAARPTLQKMRDLRFRPMLLAHVDAVVDRATEWTTYGILEAMVEAWLGREQVKARQRGSTVTWQQLRDACVCVAMHMFRNDLLALDEAALRTVVESDVQIDGLAHLEIGGRSLLNRRSDGAYRFAHRLVQEFLAVHWAIAHPDQALGFQASDAMQQMAGDHFRSTGFLLTSILPHAVDEFGYYEDLAIAGVKVRFRLIPAGTFMMGSPRGEKGRQEREVSHEVTLTQPFWLAEAPVTQALWQAVMGENPSHFKGSDRPVERVSWDDVGRFLELLRGGYGLTLPTEAQWEYACRAGTDGARYGELDDVGWYDGNSDSTTHPVKCKQPNAWGLYDMLGNVWEWCADWHGGYEPGASEDPTGPEEGSIRVLRGGSWNDAAGYVRAAFRVGFHPGNRFRYLGFRLSRGPAPSARSAEPRGAGSRGEAPSRDERP